MGQSRLFRRLPDNHDREEQDKQNNQAGGTSLKRGRIKQIFPVGLICVIPGGYKLRRLFFGAAKFFPPGLWPVVVVPARPASRVACIVLVPMLVYPIYLVLSMIFSIFIVLYFLYIGCKIATNIIFVQFYFAVSLNIIYKGHRQPDTPGG